MAEGGVRPNSGNIPIRQVVRKMQPILSTNRASEATRNLPFRGARSRKVERSGLIAKDSSRVLDPHFVGDTGFGQLSSGLIMRFAKIGIVLVAAIVLLVACATQPPPSALEPPGFLFGLLHGAISPFALIAGFFTDVRIYAFPNSGWWYDLGFMIGLGVVFGGSTSAV
jgi:hypothetical protein